MASQQEDRHEQNKQADNKEAQQQREQQRKSTNEEKFTWQPGDVKVYNSLDEIPGFQPFPVKEKKKADKAETEK